MKKVLLCFAFASASMVGNAQSFMETISPSFNNPAIKLDCKLFDGNYNRTDDFVDVLAISGDSMVYDVDKNVFAPMRGNIFSIYAIQGFEGKASDSAATVYASINKSDKDPATGDVGGLIMFKIKRDKTSGWKVITENFGGPDDRDIYFTKVNFAGVGGTIGNQGMAFGNVNTGISKKMFLIEDISMIKSNKDLVGIYDTTDYKYPAKYTKATQSRSIIDANRSVKKYQSLGWPVQVNVETGTVTGKAHRFGRGVTSILDFGAETYLVLGGNPSVLLKYDPYTTSAKEENIDFGKGPVDIDGDGGIYLSAYKQNEDGIGSFIKLNNTVKVDSVLGLLPGTIDNPKPVMGMIPTYEQNFDSLMVLKEVALRAGATMFANIGDIALSKDEYGDDVILLTEKGVDASGAAYNTGAATNAKLAKHLQELDAKDNSVDKSFADPFGRVLAIGDVSSQTSNPMSLYTIAEGGSAINGTFFSNPNKLEVFLMPVEGGVEVILIKEDVPAITKGRNPAEISSFSQRVNEIFALESQKGLITSSVGQLKFGVYPALAAITPDLKLVLAGSNGSSFTSNSYISGTSGTNHITFTENSTKTYLTVVNGINGTDKSMILAVRDIYSAPRPCLEPTGILDNNEYTKGGFQVWPNPTKASIETNEIGNYSLLNLNGQEVLKIQADNKLDMSALPKGMYYLKNQKGNIEKVVKE